MRRINANRIVERIERLAKCSTTSRGVTRLAFTDKSDQAEKLIKLWMEDAGMIVRKDEMGNIIGRYEGRNRENSVLLVGSHSDSVPNGGKYDGTLGVISAIEAIQAFHNNQEIPRNPIEVISFCDEEGARFHTTFLGSRALAGTLTTVDFSRTDDQGISVAEAMQAKNLPPENISAAKRDSSKLLGYLELHIEQGPVLEELNLPCGVVSGIAGVSRFSFVVRGSAGHAGTVPMRNRRDALSGCAEILLKVEQLAQQYNPIVATVGKLVVKPGASNVIPNEVLGTLDVRGNDLGKRREFLQVLFEAIDKICTIRSLNFHLEKVLEVAPVLCSENLITLIEESLLNKGIRPVQLISGAGHDAMAISSLTDIGMIFVRCKNGLSHCPEEYVSLEDIYTSTQVLCDTVWKVANS